MNTQRPSLLPLPSVLSRLDVSQLRVLRSDRYDGGGFSVTLAKLSPADQELVAQVYGALRLICDVVLYMGEHKDSEILLRLLRKLRPDLAAVRKLGQSTDKTDLLQQVFHDLRAGAMTALYGYLEMLEDGEPFDDVDLQQCLVLAFDHSKMMRNALEDLDPWIREADERLSLHSVQAQLARWKNTRFKIGERQIQLLCVSESDGIMSNRCLETSSIDRVAYNLMNNAARFSASDSISFSVEDVTDDLLRFVVSNRVDAEHALWLQQNVGADLNVLWSGGRTREGHGVGLKNCAELVTRSFGLVTLDDAIEDGYLGLTLEEDVYSAWFHWPLYHAQEGDLSCSC